ncbi:SCO family protein [Celeribacter indicus]|uniref:Electron transport protein SCO1/SenC n=1 Tax=Celeribacter indicus TaxID=1208324 RepID=A0A0B5DNW1_9RHOB|nr:SCO family protein [Celeribacter indicus]AJE44904.1 electron transport protein SCO1/SenC [Celeribacter indicus]SDW97605.1 protein SCO1/2 [Celeribacter indicus]
MSTKTLALAAGVAVAALLAATAWYALRPGQEEDRFAQCRGSAVSGGAGAIGGPFELVNEDGQTVTDSEVFTKPTILYFGYTFCPDVCPLDSMRNADAQRLLEERGYEVQTAFITVDPERDTPEVVKEFTDVFHEDMIGLTGSPEQVKAASQAYKTYYKKQEGDSDYYLVDHSTFSYLVFPEVGFVDFFRREDTPEQMADRIACFADAAG